ncbi:MAG: sigma 54-interacting transcriptional regulator [Deltaproteobacteria bacterium]|nr:sigma 54-interacting transcriptional regulator [Candidatus Zymogenaceae bacterium]
MKEKTSISHLHTNKHFVDLILDNIADGVFTVDTDWKITSFNTAAENIVGIEKSEALGRRCHDVFSASICTSRCALRHSIETGEAIIDQKIDIINSSGDKVPISISTAVMRDADGTVLGGVETFRDLSAMEELRKEISSRYTFEDIVGKHQAILDIFDILPDISESDSTVLIEGKSGTGKELFARAIHNLSPRSSGPFVAVNCAALPESLLESELFGYVRGAFTNATQDKPGRFALAKAGTILLDEVGELPLPTQVKLLRVLQERSYEPLGSVKSVDADVRIIASTNRDLAQMVREGLFREDLFFRLNVLRIRLPELINRRGDIPLLVDHFVARHAARTGKPIVGVSDDVLSFLMRYNFPGNVRELENIIEHGVVLCRGEIIEMEHLPTELFGNAPALMSEIGTGDLKTTRSQAEKQIIIDALARYDGNRLQTARELGMHKTTLWRKMKKFGLL